MGVIYALYGDDRVIRYIGHTKNTLAYALPRLRSAAKDVERVSALHVWIREVGLYGFYGKVLEEGVEDDSVAERLRYWHSVYGPELLSKAPVGPSKRFVERGRRTISDEHREAISKAHTGKTISAETRAKISAKALGHTRNSGKRHTDEAKAKMSFKHHERLHSSQGIIKETCTWCTR